MGVRAFFFATATAYGVEERILRFYELRPCGTVHRAVRGNQGTNALVSIW
jgi:hypothetical protein